MAARHSCLLHTHISKAHPESPPQLPLRQPQGSWGPQSHRHSLPGPLQRHCVSPALKDSCFYLVGRHGGTWPLPLGPDCVLRCPSVS
jgi:hypothetical protein